MKLPQPKYSIGDVVIIRGSQLEIERALTIKSIQVRMWFDYGSDQSSVKYELKESLWFHDESEILHKVKKL